MFKEAVYDGTCQGAYFLAINLHLTSGKDITFVGEGANGVTGPTKYFDCEAVVTVSPKQLGEAKDVNELIMLLADGVCDMNGDDLCSTRKIFESSNPREYEIFDWETGNVETGIADAFDYVQEILNQVHDMNEIECVTIIGIENEYGEEYSKEYTYNKKTKEYSLIIEGQEPFEREEDAGGALCFKDEHLIV